MLDYFNNFSVINLAEFLAMSASMLGAFLVSRKDTKNNKYYGFLAFFISNIFMSIVAIDKGMVPLMIQLAFFAIGAYLGIKYELNKKNNFHLIHILNKFSLIMIIFTIIYFLFNLKESYSFSITNIEIIAATMAIIGNFFMRYDTYYKFLAFLLFLLADILYIIVAKDHEMYFFLIQSTFFIYTSLYGMYQSYLEIQQKNCRIAPKKIFKYGG